MCEMKGIATIAIVVVITVFCAVVGVVSTKYLGPDNEVEQLMEQEIKYETGLGVDLSPDK